jgi:hypothetical protein
MGTLFGPGAMGLPLYGAHASTKTEDGVAYPKRDFAYTPSDAPSTWKLRLTSSPGGKPDPHIVGAAVAALGKGFRGNKVMIPAGDLGAVKRRVLRAWHAANPGKDEVPEVLRNLDAAVDGVAPPGWEHSIKQMKKDSAIDNPFALAWFMRNRGAKPAQRGNAMQASADETALLRTLIRQQQQTPPLCLAAARGETWAQAQLLDPFCPALMVEGKW